MTERQTVNELPKSRKGVVAVLSRFFLIRPAGAQRHLARLCLPNSRSSVRPWLLPIESSIASTIPAIRGRFPTTSRFSGRLVSSRTLSDYEGFTLAWSRMSEATSFTRTRRSELVSGTDSSWPMAHSSISRTRRRSSASEIPIRS